MEKTNLTLKEICEKAFSTFETRGYGPKFLNDGWYSCSAKG